MNTGLEVRDRADNALTDDERCTNLARRSASWLPAHREPQQRIDELEQALAETQSALCAIADCPRRRVEDLEEMQAIAERALANYRHAA